MSRAIIIIGAIIQIPICVLLQIIGFLFQFSNTKIVYKSGHVEYYFFKSISYEGHGKSKSIEWETATLKQPILLNVDEIESIVKIW